MDFTEHKYTINDAAPLLTFAFTAQLTTRMAKSLRLKQQHYHYHAQHTAV